MSGMPDHALFRSLVAERVPALMLMWRVLEVEGLHIWFGSDCRGLP